MMTLAQQANRCLSVLHGLPLWSSARAADLQSFQFGDRRILPSRQGETREVGEFALHIQCAWRISGPNGIIVGSRDRYIPRKNAEPTLDFNWDEPGNNRCDERISVFFCEHSTSTVTSVHSDRVGGFNLFLDGGFSLEVFPDDSTQDEYWRLFVPGSDQQHAVMNGHALEYV